MKQDIAIPPELDNGERMIPDAHRGAIVYAEHIVRYIFAAPLVAGKAVLDIASGSGYGSQLLLEAGARNVAGVDLSPEAVRYADGRYSSPRPNFLAGDAERLPFRDASFDVVVSFETIEHLHDPFAFLAEVRRVLVPNGLFAVSSPNKGVFVEGNPFHVHEFTAQELTTALIERFKNVRTYFQNDWIASGVFTESTTSAEGPVAGIATQKVASLQPAETLFVLSLCSDGVVPQPDELMTLGHVYEMKGFMEEAARLNHEIEELRKLWDVIAEKETHIQNFGRMVSEKDGHVQALQAKVDEQHRRLAELEKWARLSRVLTTPARLARRMGTRRNSRKS